MCGLDTADHSASPSPCRCSFSAPSPPAGSSVWKPEEPAVLRAEQEERRRGAAEARGKKLRSQLDVKRKASAVQSCWLQLGGGLECSCVGPLAGLCCEAGQRRL